MNIYNVIILLYIQVTHHYFSHCLQASSVWDDASEQREEKRIHVTYQH